ncbi:hypothetical protein [Actinoplanes auranticolor]|uniref:Uncharacterized protein n=1 Tax=Actinoplanes auranticolor TaxID=47988 RepID=A0A919SVZ0_9ACTN|nr:hypothetical protein [Actinoplanes auranticolor]GIM79004.1 hypothetical protein Aau02nite_83670 [Actinoplanes auranticolor]
MTDTDIRTALEHATGDLRTPPDLLDRVRAGGQRRVVRRRTVLAAGLATIAAGSTAGVLAAGGDGGGATVASPLLDRPTRGDLKRDTAFLDRVRAAWREHLGGLSVRGEAHVAWAGLAPHTGRAAVVAQRVPEQVASPAGQISYGLTGFVEQTPDGLRVICLEEMLTGATNATAALIGPDRNVLMVLDDGRGIRYSPAVAYTADGKVSRTFTPLDFRTHDGVAFEAITTPTTTIRAALRADVPDARGDRSVGLANLSQLIGEAGGGAPVGPEPETRSLTGTDPQGTADDPWDITGRDGFDDRYGYRITPPPGTWFVRGIVADGRRFAVQTLTGTDDRIRLFLSLNTPEPVLRGFPDPAAPLPVQVRLPDGLGVVVAAPGRLRYRVAGGTWLPLDVDAALLPAAADEVEVITAGGRAVRVRLA